LQAEVAAFRDRAHGKGTHARTPGIVADLAAGWHYWLDYALAAGAINQDEREQLANRVWTALQDVGTSQAEHVAAAEPCGHFLRLLAGALASGRAHVANAEGGRPVDAEAWGWRGTEVITNNGRDTRWDPLGRCIGWIDGANLYLEPEAAYAEAQEMARHQGESLSVAARTLWKRFHERKLLASRDEARKRNTVRRRLGGADRRALVHLWAETLHQQQPSPPSPDSQAPEPNGDTPGDSPGDSGPVSATDCPQQPSPESGESYGGSTSGADGDGSEDMYPVRSGGNTSPSACRYPHHRCRWRSVHGRVLCGICAPPAGPHLVAEWLDDPPEAA
jgi:hypothetical protein